MYSVKTTHINIIVFIYLTREKCGYNYTYTKKILIVSAEWQPYGARVKINAVSFKAREIKTPYPFLCGIYVDHKIERTLFKP